MNADLIVTASILAGYVTLLLELTLLHVPSVASNRAIWKAEKQVTDYYSVRYQWIFQLSKLQKLVFFNLPLIGVYITFFLPLLILLNENTLSPTLFSVNVMAQILGITMIFSGRFITLYSVVSIRKENSQKQNCFKLHTRQLFSKSRNPGLLGMYIFMLGIWLCLPSILFLGALFYYIFYMHIKVKMEEDFLLNKFGIDYQNYLQSTGRYLS